MPVLTFASQSARRADDPGQSPERLVNLYPQPGLESAKGGFPLRSVLGLTTFADLGITLTRAITAAAGSLWVAGSGSLFEIDSGGTVTNRGAIIDSVDTFISSNGTKITICAGGTYYVWDGSTLDTIAGGRITTEATVDFHAFYTLMTDSTTGEFEWTVLNDPKTRSGLHFATAESRNDNLRRVVVNGREVWLFGEESVEVWYAPGGAGADAFKRLPGAAVNTGILAAGLAVQMADRVFFIDDKGVASQTDGLLIAPISTPPVEVAISESTPTHCFTYSDEGHLFFVIRFSDRPAWVFDVKTRRWHERGTGPTWNEWEIIATARLNGVWYGVNTLGKIYSMSRTNDDAGMALSRMTQSSNIYKGGDFFTIYRFELLGEVGTSEIPSDLLLDPDGNPLSDPDGVPILDVDGTEINIGRAVTVAFQISRDGGLTWEPQMFRSFGKIGEYRQRAIWNALGGAEQMAGRVIITDKTDVNIYSSANVEIA